MIKTTLKIEGMMCSMCEAHIADAIRKAVPSAKKVTASRSRKEASFVTEEAVDTAALKSAIYATGYDCLSVESAQEEKKGLFNRYVNQTRKPEGFLGKLMLGGMNGGHAKLADWGMLQLRDLSPNAIAELGCGGGRNAGELLKRFPDALVTAVDYSALSVEKAKKYNRKAAEAGRIRVLQGDVSALDFADASFDLATAFETVYFWPGPTESFSEVCRILKPGGRFLIVNESDGTDKTGKQFESIIDGMKTYTAEELETALKDAGFASVRIAHHPQKPWLAILAAKGN